MNGEEMFMKLDADGLMFNDIVTREEIVGENGIGDGVVDED